MYLNKINFNYLRFHRSFIEASQEYYKSMFETSAEKDELIMNVIDYFTEKWNEKKSDGNSGKMKKFKYFLKTLNGFPKEKDQNDFEYLDYRNTKTQKVRKEILKNGKTEIIYNKRKLSEFVNLVNMLHGDENKVELLKENVYLNSEFMTSKAELCEIFFVSSMHETILKLGDKELSDISQTFVDKFIFIEQDPKTLIFNILSGLGSRNDNIRQFSASNNLLLLHSYKKEDIERELFISEDHRILYFWIIKDTPYMLIMTYESKYYQAYLEFRYSNAKIHLINAKTKQRLGTIDLGTEGELNRNIGIVINDSIYLSKH